MQLLLLSPYHGGSHKSWAEGYARTSENVVGLLTLPDRFWKWRMHGGSITISRDYAARKINFPVAAGYQLRMKFRPDAILATDMVDLTTFLSLTRAVLSDVPAIMFMHENQLTYPLPDSGDEGPMRRQLGERDLHYAFINYASALAADHIFFNSQSHFDAYFEALPRYLNRFPDFKELETCEIIEDKSSVLPVGVDLSRFDRWKPSAGNNDHPLIIWNQRWEYDKNPTLFFEVLYQIKSEGIPFRLALCGQNFRQHPLEFEQGRQKLHNEIVQFGFAPEDQYAQLLWDATITLSTAHHEFFGISIVEAVYCQTFPILPKRLSYPELIPRPFHDTCLYDSEEDLINRLRWALTHPKEINQLTLDLAPRVRQFDWKKLAVDYDRVIGSICKREALING